MNGDRPILGHMLVKCFARLPLSCLCSQSDPGFAEAGYCGPAVVSVEYIRGYISEKGGATSQLRDELLGSKGDSGRATEHKKCHRLTPQVAHDLACQLGVVESLSCDGDDRPRGTWWAWGTLNS